MIKPMELKLEELGELASIIPGQEPKLELSVDRIPVSEIAGKIIPVCEPDLRGRELEYVTDCIQSNWISSAGKYVTEFEQQFSEHCGAKYGVACSNGTTALHLAMATLGIGPGDEVIIPTFTMIATANAVSYTGATPVLVDTEYETWNMDVSKIEEKITERTKAIMVMHTYGHPVDMDPVLEIAKCKLHGKGEYSPRLYVVEDAAAAHGAEYRGKRIGSLGDVACFSFYGNRIITTGEGGMLVTNNEEIAQISRNLRDHAFSTERHFWHKYMGFNYRMTNLQAAIGLAQTERFEEMVEIRRGNAQYYSQLLGDIRGIRTPPEASWAKNVYWMYSIMIEEEFGHTRDEVREYLAKHGVETRTFFIPIHVQPIYFHKYHERFPVAEELCRKGMYLPSASTLKKKEIEYVVDCILSFAD